MPNRDLAAKAVQREVLDTWTRGGPVGTQFFTDLQAVAKGGDSVVVPYTQPTTVNTTESASVRSNSLLFDSLTVDQFRYINEEITVQQYDLLVGGNGNYARIHAQRMTADMQNSIDEFYVNSLIKCAALDAGNHINLDLTGTIGDALVGDVTTLMMEQQGIRTNHTLKWLASPRAHNQLKVTANYAPNRQAQSGEQAFGLPQIATLDGYSFMQHQAVPGRVDALRLQAAGTASTIASNVVTVTVSEADAAKFVVGQLVWTSGFTNDVAVGSPVAITAKTSTTLTFAVTGSDGSNGTGTVYSASSMALLVNQDWMFLSDTGIPRTHEVKRETNAGWSLQMSIYLGEAFHAGAVKVLHLPD